MIATLTANTEELLARYLASLSFTLPLAAPFIRNRSGHVYSKDTLGDDFRDVREVAFPGDRRQLMDLRRSGNVEAVVGGAEPAHLAAKLSNTIAQSNMLFDTYTPVQLAAVREADKARIKGRRRLRLAKIAEGIASERDPADANKSGKFPTSAPASESELASKTRRRTAPKR